MMLLQEHEEHRTPKAALAVLLVAALSLLYCNWWLLTEPVDLSPIEPAEKSVAKSSAEPLLETQTPLDLADLTETTARPLFIPARRQPARDVARAAGAVVDTKAGAPEELSLIGVIGYTNGKKALIRKDPNQPGTWISIGEEVQGWRVTDITHDAAVLETREGKHTLRLIYASKPTGDGERR